MSHANEGKKIEGHDYDGIEELDHAPPNWFQILFLVSIVFAAGYWFYYTLGGGPTLVAEYTQQRELDEAAQKLRLASEGAGKPISEDELKAFAKNPARKKIGQTAFQSKCAACHGAHGQGGIGPNLTDHYWLHGGKLTEIEATISKGILDKGMPPWGAILSKDELNSVTAYIYTLLDTKPAGAKVPQGTLLESE